MKFVIAPDSFKESLTALEVATAIETGFKRVFPDADYVKLPMADGAKVQFNPLWMPRKASSLNVKSPRLWVTK